MSERAAIVTGGGTGIGRAAALGLAAEGARVLVVGRRVGPLREAARAIRDGGGVGALASCDVSTEKGARRAVASCLRAFGRLDILVNNAGIYRGGTVTSVRLESWREVLAANLDSVFLMSRLAMPHLARRGGVIVNVSSTLGFRGMADSAAYCASKAAVENLTRAMAIDHAAQGVRVVAVSPGIVETDMGLRGERRTNARLRRRLAALHPWGRLGRPEDVASIIVHLCRPESEWITGSVHVVDGGLSAKG